MVKIYSPNFLDHALVDISRHSSGDSSSTGRQRCLDADSRDLMNGITCYHYKNGQHITIQASTNPTAWAVVTMEERHQLGCQNVTEQGSVAHYLQPLDSPMPTLHNDPPSSSTCDSPIGNRDPPAVEERGPDEVLFVQPKIRKAVILILAVIILVVIIAPGVVLGVLMEQVEMGIALAGAVATVIGIFAGFYYYSNKG